MNIFITDPCPVKSAQYLDNKRRNKMLLESCQILCSALHHYNKPAPYRPSHVNHPVSIWTRSSRENYLWVVAHARELSRLYTETTGKTHKCSLLLDNLEEMSVCLPSFGLQPFVNCAANADFGVSYKHIVDVCTAYQLYLNDRWAMDKLEPRWGRYDRKHFIAICGNFCVFN